MSVQYLDPGPLPLLRRIRDDQTGAEETVLMEHPAIIGNDVYRFGFTLDLSLGLYSGPRPLDDANLHMILDKLVPAVVAERTGVRP